MVLLCLTFATASAQNDPGIADTVRIDSLVTFGTGARTLPIHFFNDEPLAAVELTLRENSSSIIIDSVSFIGSRLATISFKGWSQDAGNQITTLFAFATVDLIPVGTGLMGTIHFRVLDASPLSIPVDSSSFLEGPLLRTTSFTPDGSVSPFVPKFKKGWVTINVAPNSLDSLWVDSLSAVRGTQIALPISLFNETDLTKIAVALDYGSDDLIFDSVTFSGGRVAGATNTVSHNDVVNTLYITSTLSDLSPLLPGTGVMAWMHFTVPIAASPGLVTVDSTTYFGLFGTELTRSTGAGGGVFVPIFNDGKILIEVTTDVDDDLSVPRVFSLNQNYPNPFNPSTEISYSIASRSHVRLALYDLLGREVATLVDSEQSAGEYTITLDAFSTEGRSLPTGVYFYRLTAGEQSAVRKMLLLK